MVLTIFVLLVIFGLLVFVHELGHFTVARRNGVKVTEFGLGFPPRMVGVQFIGEEDRLSSKNGRWRIIWGEVDGDDKNEKADLSEAHEKRMAGGTIYSINWIPIGGFVKIKGEDGGFQDDSDSFSSKSPWVKFKILFAGVAMNFISAWLIIAVILMAGAPEISNEEANVSGAKIQIVEVIAGSPAEEMGLKTGDEIVVTQNYQNISQFQSYIKEHRGESTDILIRRGQEVKKMTGIPRMEASANEGALGIGLAQVVNHQYSWYQALGLGFFRLLVLIWSMILGLGEIMLSFFGWTKTSLEVSGPIGIANFVQQALILGWVYVMQLAAVLSANLAIINILPIPALDGGRILFVLIEKIKGRPVSQKIEQAFHSAGFVLLFILMIVVTFRDIYKFIK